MQMQIGDPITENWFAYVSHQKICVVSPDADHLYNHEGFSKKKIFPIEIRVTGPALCHDGDCNECEGCWSR